LKWWRGLEERGVKKPPPPQKPPNLVVGAELPLLKKVTMGGGEEESRGEIVKRTNWMGRGGVLGGHERRKLKKKR